jgi:IPTL-CTERM motif
MDGKFGKLRFSEFTKAATVGAIVGAAALVPGAAKAATGSIEIDQGGAKWFVNTNITFTSTSSQFGFSSATLITAGTIVTRNDAYDGALAWHVYAGTPPGGPDGTFGYKSPGGTVSVTANSVLGSVQSLAGLNVQGQLWFAPNKAVARSILTLQNPTGADITVTVDNDNNLGSDNGTSIQATSSGDATFDPSDNWWVSCQLGNPNTSECIMPGNGDGAQDPINTFAFQGQGGAVRGTNLGAPFQNGNDNPNERFSNVVVPAGQTRALMYLVQLSDTPAHAIADAAIFNSGSSVSSAGYLAALPNGLLPKQIVNWNLAAGIPTLSEWGLGGMAALLGLIGLGAVGRRRSAQRS